MIGLTQEFLIQSLGNSVVCVLNSEKTLNSLTLQMLKGLQSYLIKIQNEKSPSIIFLKGAGNRAFCAGGNIRELRDYILDKPETAKEFFLTEYSTDYLIHVYKKPIVAWLHGITMGGGLGLTNGARLRVATPSTVLAMPEISIGLYPDVGAFFFLNRLNIPGLGLFMALTGARVSGSDAVIAGLCDVLCPEDGFLKLHDLFKDLTQNISREELVAQVRKSGFELQMPLSSTQFTPEVCNRLSRAAEFQDIQSYLEFFTRKENELSAFEKDSLDRLRKGSPTSAAVTFERFKFSWKHSIRETLRADIDMSFAFGVNPDFVEGVRALVVDKDLNPQWKPAKLEEVTSAYRDVFLKPLTSQTENHPFELRVKQLGIHS